MRNYGCSERTVVHNCHNFFEKLNKSFCRGSVVTCTYLVTFSMLMEHFQMAPVVAASNCLFAAWLSNMTSGFSPPYCRTRSRVCLSSAH